MKFPEKKIGNFSFSRSLLIRPSQLVRIERILFEFLIQLYNHVNRKVYFNIYFFFSQKNEITFYEKHVKKEINNKHYQKRKSKQQAEHNINFFL